jgi:hypothetical protein
MAVVDERMDLAGQLHQHSAASLRLVKVEVEPRLKSAMHRCSVPVVPESFGDESAVALPASDCSLGICTLNLGLLSLMRRLFVRDGGGIADIEDVDCVRCGGCWIGKDCEACGRGLCSPFGCGRDIAATSMDSDLFSCLMYGAWFMVLLLLPQCAASMDWLSSIGVKMLCLADAWSGFGCGRGGLWKSLCCGGDGTVIVGCCGRSCGG